MIGFQHSLCLDGAMLKGWHYKHHEAHLCQEYPLTCQDAADWGRSQTWEGGEGPLASTPHVCKVAGGHHSCCSPALSASMPVCRNNFEKHTLTMGKNVVVGCVYGESRVTLSYVCDLESSRRDDLQLAA